MCQWIEVSTAADAFGRGFECLQLGGSANKRVEVRVRPAMAEVAPEGGGGVGVGTCVANDSLCSEIVSGYVE